MEVGAEGRHGDLVSLHSEDEAGKLALRTGQALQVQHNLPTHVHTNYVLILSPEFLDWTVSGRRRSLQLGGRLPLRF